MPATAQVDSASRKDWTTATRRLTLIALAGAALVASGSHAFAAAIPIQATLTGGGEVPPNGSPAKGLMVGTLRHRHEHTGLGGNLYRIIQPADRRSFPWTGILSRLNP